MYHSKKEKDYKLPGEVGHDQLHYEALQEIIIFKAVVLPNDTDICDSPSKNPNSLQ